MHGYYLRTVADVPLDGRPVVLRVRVRRLVFPTMGCRSTFREQVPGVLERNQRRTARLTGQVRSVVRELARRAGVRLLAALPVRLSRQTAIRVLLRIPLPPRLVPKAVGVDDFALRRRRRYSTVVVDAETHARIDVLPDRKADTLADWLREHSGVEIVARDGSTTYAQAVRRALPAAIQVSDAVASLARPGPSQARRSRHRAAGRGTDHRPRLGYRRGQRPVHRYHRRHCVRDRHPRRGTLCWNASGARLPAPGPSGRGAAGHRPRRSGGERPAPRPDRRSSPDGCHRLSRLRGAPDVLGPAAAPPHVDRTGRR
ncbi:hypothetical protein HGB38_05880 [Nocardia gamkensis]|uniref:Transposase IS204/IS1001/IS1096/IS1165 DDE domain-containing protein n=1 Tax=Nocardia gamkensis TaxID=352869 RepID=A0A7X6L111_9NOCA|nr:hypothetical protein [Nocardia gamkensis]